MYEIFTPNSWPKNAGAAYTLCVNDPFDMLQETTVFSVHMPKEWHDFSITFSYTLHIFCQMLHFLFQEKKIINIQAVWRGYKLRKMFLSLFREAQPSFKVVRSFAHHFDFTADDYRRDLQLQVKQMTVYRHSLSSCIRCILPIILHLANKIYYILITGNFNKLIQLKLSFRSHFKEKGILLTIILIFT
jgi:hypothetical protein